MTTRRTAIVTGATSGLGAAAAVALGREGFKVLIVGRDKERGGEVAAKVKEAGGEAEVVIGDLFTVADLKRLGRELGERAPKLDLLVNNAGGTFGQKVLTGDGLERTFALNVLAPHLLTEALLPSLSAAKGRVVNLVTGVPRKAKATLEQLAGAESGAGIGSYTRAKLALGALTKEQQRRHGASGVTFVSLHPGIIPGTGFGQDMPAFLRRFGGFIARLFGMASTSDQAAARYVRLATGEIEGGAFYAEGKLAPAPIQAEDPAFGAALFGKLEALSQRPPALHA